MKKLFVILLSFIHVGLFANAGNRYHSCQGEHATLTFAESSFLNEPIVTLKYQGNHTWSGSDIEILQTSPDSGVYVKILDAAQNYPIMLNFFAHRPNISSQVFHRYEMVVKAYDITKDISEHILMKCYSQIVHMWPVDLANL